MNKLESFINKKEKLIICLIILIGGFFRFLKLDWGQGNFFNPDERNIVSVALSLHPPYNYHFFTQGTFSYGSLFSYIGYWALLIYEKISPAVNSFAFITIFLRSISALLSTLSVYLIYRIANLMNSKMKSLNLSKFGLLAALFLAFSPGAIQAAHYLTSESTLSFFYLLVFYYSILLLAKKSLKYFFLSIITLAIASSLKITSLILLPLPFISLLFIQIKENKWLKILFIPISLLLLILITITLSPYYLTPDFRGMLNYEQNVVRGTLDVFYTRSFIGSTPIFYQLIKIIPFITNPLFSLVIPIASVYFLIVIIKDLLQKKFNIYLFLTFSTCILLFIPNAFLYTKWTRYIIPSLPFLILLISLFIAKIKKGWLLNIFILITVITSCLSGISFSSIYLHDDIRLTASIWIYKNIPEDKKILSETANVIDIPLFPKEYPYKSYQVNNFDFYNLDSDPTIKNKLISELVSSDYIFIPSRRLFAGMGSFPEKYPLLNHYYNLLFSGQLGFTEIKEFSSYPRIGPFEFPDEMADETWSVFDHPIIRIYKKSLSLTKDDYDKLLEI